MFYHPDLFSFISARRHPIRFTRNITSKDGNANNRIYSPSAFFRRSYTKLHRYLYIYLPTGKGGTVATNRRFKNLIFNCSKKVLTIEYCYVTITIDKTFLINVLSAFKVLQHFRGIFFCVSYGFNTSTWSPPTLNTPYKMYL